jgi:DNA polymerase III sliding clamp (beta) subunit (PCNA family)
LQTTQQTDNTLFEARTRKPLHVKRLLRTLSNTVTDTSVTIDEDGITFHAADPKTVAMIHVTLKPDLFDRWQPPTEPVHLGVDADDLLDRVSNANKNDELTLSLTREHDGVVIHAAVYNDGIRSTFAVPSIDADDIKQPDTSDLDFDARAIVAFNAFSDAVKQLGDSIRLRLSDTDLTLATDTDASVTFPASSDHLHGVRIDTTDGTVESMYSRDYLSDLRSLRHTASRVELRFGDDYPLQVAADSDEFLLEYTLAPRIEE